MIRLIELMFCFNVYSIEDLKYSGSDGAAVKELLTTIMTNTPHMWSQHTLQCFPPVLVEFFGQVSVIHISYI